MASEMYRWEIREGKNERERRDKKMNRSQRNRREQRYRSDNHRHGPWKQNCFIYATVAYLIQKETPQNRYTHQK